MIKTYRICNWHWMYALFIRVGGTRDQAETWFRKKFKDAKSRNNGQATTFYKVGEKSHLIWFESKLFPDVVAHEAFHSALHVLKCCGLGPPNDDTEEAYAYLIQWTVNSIRKRCS